VRPPHANHGPGETLPRPQQITLAFSPLPILLEKKPLFATSTKLALFFLPLLPWHCTCFLLRGVVFRSREVVVHIQFNWTRKIFAAAAGSLLVLSFAAAQTVNDEGKRKLKTKSGVTYPELARRMNISGKVRIEVVIAPDGRVRSARVVGGIPFSCSPALRPSRIGSTSRPVKRPRKSSSLSLRGNSSDPLGSARLLVVILWGACCSLGEWRK